MTESLLAQAVLPHGLCLPWTPDWSWPQAASNIATGLVGIAIPVGLAALLLRRSKPMSGWAFRLFVLSILAFGISHLADIGVPWLPDNCLQGLTALTSFLAAGLLWIIPPKLQIIPGRHRFRRASDDETDGRRGTAGKLRQAEMCLQFLAENVPDCAMFMVDRSGHVVSWNAGAQHVKQYEADEIIGRHFGCFYSEEDQAAGKPGRALEIAASQGIYREEGWRIRGDGSRFIAQMMIRPLPDKSGKPAGFATITRDITRARQAENDLEQARAALAQSQKMAAFGQLTGGIAHDFNNMLAAILGSLELLEVRQEAFSQNATRILQVIRHAVHHGGDLTQRLMAFSRKQAPVPTLTNTNQLVTGMAELLRRTLGNSVTVETILAEGLWPAHVDPNQVESALLNLAVNARDAMRDGGTIIIKTGNAILDEEYTRLHDDVAAGEYSFIAVSDTGSGMTPEVQERAFEPFYTTKGIGRGTGLGLSQVHDFVRQSGGHVEVRSKVGRGTTVKLYFPRPDAVRDAGTAEPKSLEGPLPRGSETILVVEDNDAVRTYSTNAARQLGYSVLEAADAKSAIKLLDKNPDVRLLFTDVELPGTNGPELADRAKTVRPDLKVVFTSGYKQSSPSSPELPEREELFLPKPFLMESFAQILRSALDAA